MSTTVRVSVPIYAIGSRIDFHLPTEVAVIQLPFEALGNEAEEDRQRAFHVIAAYGGRVGWKRRGERYEGSLELSSAEIRAITDLASSLEEARLVG